MKRFIKLLNIRLDKCFLQVSLVLVIQLLVITIAGALNTSKSIQGLGLPQMIMSYNTLYEFDFIFSAVATILSIIVINILSVRVGDIKYYLAQGINSSDNMLINLSMGTIFSVMVALAYYMGTMFGRLLAILINSEFYSLAQLSNFAISASLWKNVASMLFISIVVFLLFSCLYKTYLWNKAIAITAISCILLGVILFFMVGLLGLPELVRQKLFTATGGIVLGSIVALISASVYVAIELKGDITR